MSIKTKIVLILLFTSQLFATDWYISKNGSNTSPYNTWAKARTTFVDFPWTSVAPGDYVYIDGGADSMVYNETLIPQTIGTSANWITIIAGKYSPSPSGHSGRVIIDGGYGISGASIYINEFGSNQTPHYTKIKGFETRGGVSGVHLDIDSYTNPSRAIILDSLRITDWLDLAGILVKGHSDSTVIQYCTIISCVSCGVGDKQTDCIHFNGVDTRYPEFSVIHDNFLDNRNQDPTAHNDAIQSVLADGFVIYNNVVINDSVFSFQGGGMPYILSSIDYDNNDSPPVILFNNFSYMGGVWWPVGNEGLNYEFRHDDGGDNWGEVSPSFAFNNTFVVNGPRVYGVGNQGEAFCDLFVNNIIAIFCLPDGTYGEAWRSGATHGWHGVLAFSDSYGHQHRMDSIRTTLVWRSDSLDGLMPPQGEKLIQGYYVYTTGGYGEIANWTDWVAKGGTGLFRNPKFVSNFGYEPSQLALIPDIESNSPAINAGEDLTYLYYYFISRFGIALPEMFYDIYGNPRNDWDIGAVEYVAAGVDTVPSFSFGALTGREKNTEYIATSAFPLAYVDSTFHIWTTTAAQFKINYNGTYNTAMKTANPQDGQDTVYVKNMTGGSYSTLYTETIVAGGSTNSRNFNVTTKNDPALTDTIPAAFTLLDYGYANLSTSYTSYPFKLTNFDSCNAYFGGSNFAIKRSGSWGSPSSTMRKIYSTDDSIRVTLTSSGSNSTPVNNTFTAGGVSDIWYVITKGAGQGADSLGVQNVEGETQEAPHPPAKTIDGKGALDGDVDSRWAATPMPKDLIFDLGVTMVVVKTRFSFYNWNASRIYQYYVSVSNDHTNWYITVPQKASTSSEYSLDSLSVGLNARYIRVTFVSNNQSTWAGLWEGKIYGTGSWTPTDTVPSFSFTALTGREKNTEYIATSAFPLAYVDSTFHIWTTTSADFKINYNGTYNTSMKTANPQDGQDTVYVKNMTGGSYSTLYRETIVAGGYPRNFDATTKVDPGGIIVGSGGRASDNTSKKIYLKNGPALITKKP